MLGQLGLAAVANAGHEDLALEAAEWKSVLPAGADVALKVNLGWDLFLPGSITSPLVAESLILELQSHVGRIVMVEADQVLEDVERAFHDSGMAEVCRRTGVEWLNMSRAPMETLDYPDNAVLREDLAALAPSPLRTISRLLRVIWAPVMKEKPSK